MKKLVSLSEASGHYRRLLIQKQLELLRELNTKRDDAIEADEPIPRDDQPPVSLESSVTQILSAIELNELSLVNSALERVRTNTYGVCEECGSPISSRRLLAIPWAERCHKCEVHHTSNELAEIGGFLGRDFRARDFITRTVG